MKFRVGVKLGLGFGLVLLLMSVSAALTYFRLADIRQTTERMMQVRVPTVDAARRLSDDLNYSASKARQGILAGTQPPRKEAAQKAFEVAWSRVDKDVAKLEEFAPHWVLLQNRERLAAIKEQLPKIRAEQQASMDTAASGIRDAVIVGGNNYADKVMPLVDATTESLGEVAQTNEDLMKQNQQEIESAESAATWTMGVASTLALAVGIVLALFLSRKISLVVSSVLQQAEAIAAGDLTREEASVKSKDELGDLTAAINRMQASLRNIIQSIAENAQSVANASEEFSAVSQQISANSEQTSAQAGAVSAATEEVNRNLQTVATATEEMSASIQEIAKNATEAAKVAAEAMKIAVETNAVVGKLGESSGQVGQVIKVITSIAQKTDLLALNATVEAARAGEVGAGFAVVANEVKELAKQTATATEDISKKIETMQVDAKGAVEAIKRISRIIDQVNAISSTIATAVEEQSATTSEMSRNLTAAAKGSGEVAQNINGVAQAAQNTSQGATDSQRAAKSLAEMSTQLRELVRQFKVDSNGHGKRSSPNAKATREPQLAGVGVR